MKGPDLARLEKLRVRVATQAADEVLLTTAGGVVLETTRASVLWWEDDKLCFPAPSLRVLPGVTTRIIQHIARDTGVRVRPRRARAAELYERECWVVNALHGIRAVQTWADPAMRAAPVCRATAWQDLLNSRAELLPGRSD